MTERDELIQDLLGDDEGERDHSLRGKSLARADGAHVPRTLTPDEWADWYEQQGVPEAHRRSGRHAGADRSWGDRFRAWIRKLRGSA